MTRPPYLDIDALLKLLCTEVEKAGSQRAWAKKHGISAPYLSDVLKKQRTAGPKILNALGLKVVVMYQKK